MEISKRKINIILARKQMTTIELAKNYGVSRARILAILKSEELTPVCVGRLAKALDVDVTEILEDEEVV